MWIEQPMREAVALDRHRARRESGVPTVTMLVGAQADNLALWRRWCGGVGRRTVCVDEVDLATIEFTWTAAALDGKQLVALVAAALAQATGESSAATISRLREERYSGAPDLLDALASRGPLWQGICAVLLTPHVDFVELWQSLSELAHSLGSGTVSILEVVAELTGWAGAPSIAISVNSAEPSAPQLLERCAAAAVKIAEAAPFLSVAVCSAASTWTTYERDSRQSHAKDVVSAGLVRPEHAVAQNAADNVERAALRQHARTSLASAKANPHDSAIDARARSVVESLVYDALQNNPYTRNRFELNAKLDVFFGSRRLEVDLLDRAGGLALEIDGYYHFRNAEAYRRDRAKDVLMQRNGLLVVRALAEDAVDALDELVARMVDLVLDQRRTREAVHE